MCLEVSLYVSFGCVPLAGCVGASVCQHDNHPECRCCILPEQLADLMDVYRMRIFGEHPICLRPCTLKSCAIVTFSGTVFENLDFNRILHHARTTHKLPDVERLVQTRIFMWLFCTLKKLKRLSAKEGKTPQSAPPRAAGGTADNCRILRTRD